MASDSGRPNEFAEDAHFWPEDPSHDQLKLWTAAHTRNEKITDQNEPPDFLLTQVGIHGKLYQIPVRIRMEED